MPDPGILVPIYNERETVATAIEQLVGAELPVSSFELVLVDDGSTDGTREWLTEQALPSNATSNTRRRASRRSCGRCWRGTRRSSRRPRLRGAPAFSFWCVVGNKSVSLAANVLFNTWLSAVMTCHKLLPTALFRALALRRVVRVRGRDHRAAVGHRHADLRGADHVQGGQPGGRQEATAYDGLRTLRTLVRCRLDGRVLKRRRAVHPGAARAERRRARALRARGRDRAALRPPGGPPPAAITTLAPAMSVRRRSHPYSSSAARGAVRSKT